jgi:hypothetical protein
VGDEVSGVVCFVTGGATELGWFATAWDRKAESEGSGVVERIPEGGFCEPSACVALGGLFAGGGLKGCEFGEQGRVEDLGCGTLVGWGLCEEFGDALAK